MIFSCERVSPYLSPIGQFMSPQFGPTAETSRLSDEVIAALAEDLLVPRRRQVSD